MFNDTNLNYAERIKLLFEDKNVRYYWDTDYAEYLANTEKSPQSTLPLLSISAPPHQYLSSNKAKLPGIIIRIRKNKINIFFFMLILKL